MCLSCRADYRSCLVLTLQLYPPGLDHCYAASQIQFNSTDPALLCVILGIHSLMDILSIASSDKYDTKFDKRLY
jgi:hypothetical protein